MLVVNKEGQQQLVMATANKPFTFTAAASPPTAPAAPVMSPAQNAAAAAAAAATAQNAERRNVAEILASLSGLKPIDLPSTTNATSTSGRSTT